VKRQAALGVVFVAIEWGEQRWNAEVRRIEGAITLEEERTSKMRQLFRIAIETPTLIAS
jgi:hypothetical protein